MFAARLIPIACDCGIIRDALQPEERGPASRQDRDRMTAARTVAIEKLLEQVGPVVRAILIRKSGMTLADDDVRSDNVDAIELHHDVLARLWERLIEATGEAADIRNFNGYAAQVTYNAWSDYLRERYPQRASLKNRLRYFLGHQPSYAIWENADNELVAGFRKWQFGANAATSERIAALRSKRDRLPTGTVPAKQMERFAASDWHQLLKALFASLGGPTSLDDLVAITAELIGLKEDRVESLDEESEEDEPSRELIDTDGSQPDRDLEVRLQLAQLWSTVRALKPEYRCAYLLNIPGPGKSRGDIEVFVLRGIATITEIGNTIGLTPAQYRVLWGAMDMEVSDRDELALLETPDEWFCVLWKYLPLGDALIGRLLGLEQQQVINRRMLALRELARALEAPSGKKIVETR